MNKKTTRKGKPDEDKEGNERSMRRRREMNAQREKKKR